MTRTSPHRRGFTLLEILVSVGIIIILVSILVPVVGRVRRSAQAADVQQQISTIATALQAYYQVFDAYPGPIPNSAIRSGSLSLNSAIPTGFAGTVDATKVTQAENLVLGLMGGLRRNGGDIEYNPSLVGGGPFSLNPQNPKRYAPFLEGQPLSWRNEQKTGQFADEAGSADDTIIPEIVDRFPDPLPILYLRARKGATRASSSAVSATNNGVVNAAGSKDSKQQYDLDDIIAYTQATGGKYIGVGKRGYSAHGLNAAPNTSLTIDTATQPYNVYPYLLNPKAAYTPRQKDGFILISAGIDRVYGTSDDITNFGSVLP
jgi:type II secretory pathway pseudopilin PulG